jgi:endonuclease/exonuclease/phosphatase (EEP) superfamily protein YafD
MAPSWLGLLGNWHWMLDLLSHFRWQYLIISLVAAALAAWRRLRITAALAILTLLLNGLLIARLSWEPEVRNASLSEGFSLRVLSINVLRSNSRTDAVLRHVMASGADVIFLMEVDDRWVAALAPLKAKYPHHFAEPRADNFGIALFSRIPLDNIQPLHFGTSDLPSIQVGMQQGGRRFVLIGTHPIPPVGSGAAALRDAQLGALADHVAQLGDPAIVVGDLNATPWSAGMRRLAGRNLGFRSRAAPWTPTWRAGSLFAIPIDHALVTAPLVVTRRAVGRDLGSDHRPLEVTVGWLRAL